MLWIQSGDQNLTQTCLQGLRGPFSQEFLEELCGVGAKNGASQKPHAVGWKNHPATFYISFPEDSQIFSPAVAVADQFTIVLKSRAEGNPPVRSRAVAVEPVRLPAKSLPVGPVPFGCVYLPPHGGHDFGPCNDLLSICEGPVEEPFGRVIINRQMTATADDAILFEQGKPLDSSLIWDWIRDYYSKGGLAVWSDGDIPFHITNTPILAQGWARSVLNLCRDFQRQGLLDLSQPVDVYELGPGTGRHAFFLLKELKRLQPLTRAFAEREIRFRVHLGELGMSGLTSLSEHPNLKKAVEDGDLVLHQFDISHHEVPTQCYPPTSDKFSASKNPVFLVANYLLDSLPHDVVRITEGRAQLGVTNLSVKGLKEGEEPTSLQDLGERIGLTFTFQEEDAQYSEPAWNAILEHYQRLGGETHIPFPTTALRLAEKARNWSEIATVFLVADKSFTTMNQLMQLEEPELVPHGGGFSFNANMHALGFHCRSLNGFVHHTSSRDGTLDLSHLVFPSKDKQEEPWQFLETCFHLEDLEVFHAVDRFRTKESVDLLEEEFPLRLCLDLLRLTGFDPQVFYELSDEILDGLESDDEDVFEMEEELSDALPRCLSLVYPLEDDVDVAFEIGRVAYRMEAYEMARQAFQLSLLQYGYDPRTHFNLGLTWYYRDRLSKALEEFEEALRLDPNYEEAKMWINRTKSKLLGGAGVS